MGLPCRLNKCQAVEKPEGRSEGMTQALCM